MAQRDPCLRLSHKGGVHNTLLSREVRACRVAASGTLCHAGCNTCFRIDPKEDLILMLFVQQAFSPGDQELQYTFQNTVMQAIVD